MQHDNCIASAAGDERNWWWPVQPYYWPAGAPRIASLAAYATVGYTPCPAGSYEIEYEKIAIYSLDVKLGPFRDVEHGRL